MRGCKCVLHCCLINDLNDQVYRKCSKNVAVCCRLFSVVVYVITLFVLSVKLGQFVRPEVKQVHFELIV